VPNARGDDNKKKAALEQLNIARENMNKALKDVDQDNIGRLNAQGQQAQDELFEQLSNNTEKEIQANEAKIKEYDEARKDLLKQRMDAPLDAVAKDVGLPPAQPDPEATTAPPPASTTGAKPKAKSADYWTTISVEVAASYEHKEAQQKSQSTSAGTYTHSFVEMEFVHFTLGAGASWGLFSAGGSMSYSKSSADASSQMAKSSVKATFECMRVDIGRSWLRADLFYDDDLTVTQGNFISPGPIRMATLMDPDNNDLKSAGIDSEQQRQNELQRYGMFPIYPVGKCQVCHSAASGAQHYTKSLLTGGQRRPRDLR
jgi:hypothetical protein